MVERSIRKFFRFLWVLAGLLVPVGLYGQGTWTKVFELPDRRETKDTIVAKVTFEAYSMNSATDPGTPIIDDAKAASDLVKFNGAQDYGYIKFKITAIEWLIDIAKEDQADYKVVVRNLWVNMMPRIYADQGGNIDLQRKRFITAQNFEYVIGDALPPPTIFKVNRNADYKFTIGVKAVTPLTAQEKPFECVFELGVRDLKGLPMEEKVVEPVKDTTPKTPVVEDPPHDDIDNAVKIAIDNEDVETLIDLINDNPKVESCKDARAYLELKMTKELIDSMTYRVDVSYSKFSRAVPNKDNLALSFSKDGAAIPDGLVHPEWKGGKLFLRPPKDGIDYQVNVEHKTAPENKSSIGLNSVKDNIQFSYKDTLDGLRCKIKVKGGHGPYMLYAERMSEGIPLPAERGIAILGDTVFDKPVIAGGFGISEEGDYRFYLVDAENLKKTGSGLIHLVPPPPIPPFVWYIAAGALGVFLIGFLIYKREQRKKDEELEKLLESRGGSDPKVKRKPKPDLQSFWKETAISDLSLHKNFIRDVATYLKERPHYKSEKPMIEGVLLGTVLKFDFENEQYEVRLDRFRALTPRALDFYEDSGEHDKWAEIREVAQDHRELVKIGWLQIVEGRPMRLSPLEQQFQDEQFSELFQLLLKIDFVDGGRLCGFFTRTTSGKINDVNDRQVGVDYWMNWDELEDAGYYEPVVKGVRDEIGDSRIKVKIKGQETV